MIDMSIVFLMQNPTELPSDEVDALLRVSGADRIVIGSADLLENDESPFRWLMIDVFMYNDFRKRLGCRGLAGQMILVDNWPGGAASELARADGIGYAVRPFTEEGLASVFG